MKFKFNNQTYLFKPRLFPFFSFLVALTLLLGLSYWQVKRLMWKTDLIQKRVTSFESEPVSLFELSNPENEEFKRIKIKGRLLNQFEFFMPALSKRGNNGFHILVPLEVNSNLTLIYDTGWVPLQKKEIEKRLDNINENEQDLVAVIRLPGRKGYFQPENDKKKNFWFFVEPKLMESTISKKLENKFYLEAYNNGPNGYPLGNQTRIYLRNNHLQYAITWLLISFGLIGVFFFANLKKK